MDEYIKKEDVMKLMKESYEAGVRAGSVTSLEFAEGATRDMIDDTSDKGLSHTIECSMEDHESELDKIFDKFMEGEYD